MKVWIVVEVERDTFSRTNSSVHKTEDSAIDYQHELDECAGGGKYDWEVEEWDIVE